MLELFVILFVLFFFLLVINIFISKKERKEIIEKYKISFKEEKISHDWENAKKFSGSNFELNNYLSSILENQKLIKQQEKEREEENQLKQKLKKEKEETIIKKYGEEKGRKILNQEFYLDMTEEELMDSKGEPTKIEKEVLKTKTKKTWIYGNKSSGDVFIFENGSLVKFKDR